MKSLLFLLIALTSLSLASYAQGQSGYGGDGKASSGATVSSFIRLYETPPSAATTALAGAGAGNVDNGAHLVKVTCYTPGGQTTGGTASNSTTVADKTVNGKIAISAIPLCSIYATGRKVYMTTAGGSTYYLLSNGTIANNTATTLTANDSDATLTASTVLPTSNTALDTRLTIGQNGVSGMELMRVGPSSTSGIIYKRTNSSTLLPYLYDFNYGNNGTVTTDGYNLFFGEQSGNLTMGATATNTYEGSYNVGLGVASLRSLTIGFGNVGVGYNTLNGVTTGQYNVTVGNQAGKVIADGNYNIGIGNGALYSNISGSSNIGLGNNTLYEVTGTGNVAIGVNTGRGISTGSYNTIIGGSVTGLSASLANNVILADGQGNKRIWIDSNGTVSLGGGAVASVVGAAATHGQAYAILQGEESLTIAAAATTDTTMQIPAGAVVLSVNVRVTTVIPTAATFTVTGATSGTTFNTAAVSTAANTTDVGTAAGSYYNATTQKIRITPNAVPGAATGVVRVTVVYYVITPPTS